MSTVCYEQFSLFQDVELFKLLGSCVSVIKLFIFFNIGLLYIIYFQNNGCEHVDECYLSRFCYRMRQFHYRVLWNVYFPLQKVSSTVYSVSKNCCWKYAMFCWMLFLTSPMAFVRTEPMTWYVLGKHSNP